MNAKEMFEELGYKKEKDIINEQFIISYKKDDCPGFYRICFSKPDKTIVARYFDENGEMYAQIVKVQEFKAINQQCRELGWLQEQKQETNLEHYFEDLLKQGGRYAFVSGKIKDCWGTKCCDCAFDGGNCLKEKIEWLASPYKKPTYKFEKPRFKLSQFEYDLLQRFSVDFKFNEIGLLKEMKEKGHFKNINGDELIKDILANCEVVKNAES